MNDQHDDSFANDDYLWDRLGPPDPLTAALEARLAPLALRADARAPLPPVAPARPRPGWRVGIAAGAALALAAGAAIWLRATPDQSATTSATPAPPPAGAWPITVIAGAPRILPAQGRAPAAWPTHLAPGDALETGAARVELAVPDTGVVEVAPGARVALVATSGGTARLELSRGTIHARIWAPPGTFFVGTPAGTAVDLGCSYTVSVDDRGAGRLDVHTGWVGFERGERESFVPAGATCALRTGHGPGTPHRQDASAAFVAALAAFDEPTGFDERARALGAVLAEARAADAVTLWHLVVRAPREDRPRVLRALHAVAPATRQVADAAVVAGDRDALDALWNKLDLGPMTLWRRWKARAR